MAYTASGTSIHIRIPSITKAAAVISYTLPVCATWQRKAKKNVNTQVNTNDKNE